MKYNLDDEIPNLFGDELIIVVGTCYKKFVSRRGMPFKEILVLSGCDLSKTVMIIIQDALDGTIYKYDGLCIYEYGRTNGYA